MGVYSNGTVTKMRGLSLGIPQKGLQKKPIIGSKALRNCAIAIEEHICICFVAYKVYKELERIIQETKLNMSVDKVLDIAKTLIYTTGEDIWHKPCQDQNLVPHSRASVIIATF